jgi:fructose-1,6-bisphosphatase
MVDYPARRVTLHRHILESQRPHREATGELSVLLTQIAHAGKIYIYPCDRRHPDGELRLLYECAPLAFVVEQAGGAASTGRAGVLEVPIQSVHQRIPFAIGSRAELERFDAFMRSGA